MPKVIVRSILILVLLAMIPPMLIARARTAKSTKPPIHPILDMDNQVKFRAQHVNPMFADGRAMRPPVAGTVARGDLREDDHYYRGLINGQFAGTFPRQIPLTAETLERGRERFEIYCTPCHGESGDGQGMIALRAARLANIGAVDGWVQPTELYNQATRDLTVGQLFNTITHGARTMPAYGPQIPVDDRWRIVAWVRVLQRAQFADWDDVPDEIRIQLEAGRQASLGGAGAEEEGADS